VIRFSAALVAVAIGVLIAGIAASELLLVYVAIVLSAVALVVLAIGVLLKRDELFGEGQGLAPAQAGANPVLSARVGENDRQSRSNGHVTPSPVPGAAVGPGAAFAGHSQAAAPQSGRAQPGTWETQDGHSSWPSPATPAPASARWQAPAASGATTAGWGAQASGEATVAGGSPTAASAAASAAAGAVQGSRVQDSAVQGGGTVPRSWGRGPLSSAPFPSDTAAPSVFAPRPAGAPPAASDAGSGSALPDWFNPSDKGASAEAPVTPPAAKPGAGGGWPWLKDDASDITTPDGKGLDGKGPDDKGEVAGAAVLDEDDDWPTRYSWLEDEPEESENGESSDSQPAENAENAENEAAVLTQAQPAGDSAVPADAVLPVAAAHEASVPAAGDLTVGAEPGEEPPADSDVAADEPPALHLARHPDPEAQVPEASSGPENEPQATTADDGAGLVTVLRGVPRFHQADCVLIRFMPAGDTQQLSAAQAREAGCTPCTACEPEG
jgi:hypothetical protein